MTALAIYSCTSARDPQLEPLLKANLTNGALMKMKSLRRDSHEQNENCLLHGPDMCISGSELN